MGKSVHREKEVLLMKVKDIMSKTVVNLNPEHTVDQAAHLMKEHNVGSIPVFSNGLDAY